MVILHALWLFSIRYDHLVYIFGLSYGHLVYFVVACCIFPVLVYILYLGKSGNPDVQY
jgi:hypothetical protein